jgi:hypothetical protein
MGPARRQTVVAADQENQIARIHFGPRHPFCEARRIHGLAARVQKNFARACASFALPMK